MRSRQRCRRGPRRRWRGDEHYRGGIEHVLNHLKVDRVIVKWTELHARNTHHHPTDAERRPVKDKYRPHRKTGHLSVGREGTRSQRGGNDPERPERRLNRLLARREHVEVHRRGRNIPHSLHAREILSLHGVGLKGVAREFAPGYIVDLHLVDCFRPRRSLELRELGAVRLVDVEKRGNVVICPR